MTDEKQKQLLAEFRDAYRNEANGAWQSCRVAWLAAQMGTWRTWAEDLGREVGKSARTVRDRADAWAMRLALYTLFPDRVERTLGKGYTWYSTALRYADIEAQPDEYRVRMDALLDMIESVETIEAFRAELAARFGDGVDGEAQGRKTLHKLLRFLGLAETYGAPDYVRDAVKNAVKALEQWLG